jgi:hypothetical protein
MQKLMPHITKHLRQINGLTRTSRQFTFKEFSAVGRKITFHRKLAILKCRVLEHLMVTQRVKEIVVS